MSNLIQSKVIFWPILLVVLFGCQQIKKPETNITIPELATKPPLGWNSYDGYGVYLTAKTGMANIEVFAEKYKPYGYEYFVIDAGWFREYELMPGRNFPAKSLNLNLDEFGLYEPSKTYFPDGLKPLIERAHELGLKFGLHLMRGLPRQAYYDNLPVKGTPYHARDIADTLSICVWSRTAYGIDMSKPGAQEWYNSLFNKLASWGIDFVKMDDMTPYPLEIIAVSKAIEQSGRPMVLSLSPGDVTNLTHLPYYKKANMLRITGDIWDRRSDLHKVFEIWKKYQGIASPGFWPDMDMIPFGQLNIEIPDGYSKDTTANFAEDFRHWCRLTKDQKQTCITARALAASPLMIGGDLLTMDDHSWSLLTNKNMLECNQNGIMGINVFNKDSVEIWHAASSDEFGKGWIGVFNRSSHDISQQFSKKDLGLKEFILSYKEIEMRGNIKLYDIWNDKNFELSESCNLDIPADGVIFMKFERKK
jgi:hypothetical protein